MKTETDTFDTNGAPAEAAAPVAPPKPGRRTPAPAVDAKAAAVAEPAPAPAPTPAPAEPPVVSTDLAGRPLPQKTRKKDGGETRHRLAEMKHDPEAIAQVFESGEYPYATKMRTKVYEGHKLELQRELLKLQRWVEDTGERVVMLFEGRDAAGKGGTIKRYMEHLNPRTARVVALQKPTERERTQWYFQRYIAHLPATAPGTTAPASSASWASARPTNISNSCVRPPSSSRC